MLNKPNADINWSQSITDEKLKHISKNIDILRLRIPTHEDGKFLYGRSYRTLNNYPDGITAKCLFLHDMGEHSVRYQDFFINFLNGHRFRNFELVSVDMRGHGRSCGVRGHIPSISQICFDTISFINSYFEKNEPIFIMGIGLGGIINLKIIHSFFSLIKKEISGIMLINPALKLKWKLPNILDFLSDNKNFLPKKLRVPFHIHGKDFAGSSSYAEAFDSDPLINHKLTLASVLEIQESAAKIRTSAYYIDLPVFIGLSGKQSLYFNQVSELFSRGISQCVLKNYSDSYHDLFHHYDSENLANDLYDWMKSNLV